LFKHEQSKIDTDNKRTTAEVQVKRYSCSVNNVDSWMCSYRYRDRYTCHTHV